VRILITDGEQRSSLAAVRSLGRAGHDVVVCSARSEPLAGASRFARATFQVPDPATAPGAFAAEVGALVSRERIDVLLPMTDVSAPLLFDLRERHPELTIPFPDRSAYERASDKVGLSDLASTMGVPVPRGLLLAARPDAPELDAEASALAAFAHEVGYPLILKPGRSSVEGERGVIRLGVRQVKDREALHAALHAYPAEAYPLLVQERISGPGLGAFVLAADGEVLASFGHCRLREKPPTGGVSVYRESVPLRADVEAHATRLLSALHWTGVAMVEFKEDSATGTPYLMEINGRFWGSLQLAIDAGVDFPRLLVDAALGRRPAHRPVPRHGIRSRWLWGDVDHLIGILKAPRGYRAINPELPSRLGAVLRFLVPWRPGDHFEVLDFGDLRPFLRETVQWFAALRARGSTG